MARTLAGDAGGALRASQAALALDKESPSALNGLPRSSADAGRGGGCCRRLRAGRDAGSVQRFLLDEPGRCSPSGLGDLGAAETAYRRALQVDANYPDALNGLGVLLVQRECVI